MISRMPTLWWPALRQELHTQATATHLGSSVVPNPRQLMQVGDIFIWYPEWGVDLCLPSTIMTPYVFQHSH